MRSRLTVGLLIALTAVAVLHAQQTPQDIAKDLHAIAAQLLQLQQQLEQKVVELDKALAGPTPPPTCTYLVTPPAAPVPSAGGIATFTIDTGQLCAWTVQAPDAWAVPSEVGGAGIAALTVTAAPNPAAARRSSIEVSGVVVTVDQEAAPPPPSAITTGAELTKALANKQPDIKIRGSLSGNFTVTAPTTLSCVTPPTPSGPNGRIAPADVAGCQLVASDKALPVLSVQSDNVMIDGLTLTGVAPDRTVLLIGTDKINTLAQLPTGIVINRTAVLGDSAGLGHRGIESNSRDTRITNSYIAGFLERYRQSQGIYCTNCAGPFLIENNYIEASGENIIFGGSDPAVPNLVTSDIIVRGNLLYKPLAQYPPNSVVNSFELKNARRVLVENNVLDGSRSDVQTGQLVVLTPRNQNGKCTWCAVEDVTFRGNVFRNYDGYGVSVICTDNLAPSGRTKNLRFENNLFETPGRGGFQIAGMDGDLIIKNNTMPRVTGSMINFVGTLPPTGVGAPCRPNLVWTNNVAMLGRYGILGQNAGSGHPTITAYTSTDVADKSKVGGNVIEESNGTAAYWGRLPAGNTLLPLGGLAPRLDANFKYTPDPSKGW